MFAHEARQDAIEPLGKPFLPDVFGQGMRAGQFLHRQNRVEAHGVLQEVQEARKITTGKAFIMQSKYVKKRFLLLTQIWSSPAVFADLPHSVSDDVEFFRAKEGSSTEKLF